MKKALTGTALATMLAAGVLAAEAGPFQGNGNVARVRHLVSPRQAHSDPVLAQNEPATPPSQTLNLGDIARKLKAQRQTEGTKPAKVFTNDNIPHRGGISVVGSEAAKTKTAEAAPPSSAGGQHGKAYFQKRAREIRSNLSLHQGELSVLQQQLAQAEMTYYPNPQKTLEQESGPAFQSDVNKIRQQIRDKQAQIASDQKAMQDLQQQLQREGGDPGWIR